VGEYSQAKTLFTIVIKFMSGLMLKRNWFFIFPIVIVILIALAAGVDCGLLGIKDLRGYGAVFIGIFFSLGIVISAVLFVLRYFKTYGLSPWGLTILLLMIVFLFFYTSTVLRLSKTYC